MFPSIPVGSLDIPSYIPVYALAFIVLLVGLNQRARQRQLTDLFSIHRVIDLVFYMIIGVAIGTWMAYVLRDLVAFLVQDQPLRANWWMGGQYSMGGIIGGIIAVYLYCRRYNFHTGKVYDLFVLVVPAVEIIGRFGCLLVGCCYGRETTAWPALVLPDDQGVWASRFPTRIVIMLGNLVILLLLLSIEYYLVKRRGKPIGWPFHGFVFLLYIQLLSLLRFFEIFWRGRVYILTGWLTWTHLYTLIGFSLASWLMIRHLKRWCTSSIDQARPV